jgi:hypothetical protein
MPTIDITVSYANGVLSVSPENAQVTSQGRNVIRWVPGTGIDSIDSISGLPSPPFTTPQRAAKKRFKTTDHNSASSATPYSYTIGYTLSVSKATGTHDPQITNEPE